MNWSQACGLKSQVIKQPLHECYEAQNWQNFLDSRFISIHKRNKQSANFESSNSEIVLRLLWCWQKLVWMRRPWGTMYELCYVVNWPVHSNS